MAKSIEDRCREFLAGEVTTSRLIAFIESEFGRKSSPDLADCHSVVLYFETKSSLDAFVDLVLDLQPGLRETDGMQITG